MPRSENESQSVTLRVTVSAHSAKLLDELAARGIWGRNRAEVAARFVDEALQKFVEKPKL